MPNYITKSHFGDTYTSFTTIDNFNDESSRYAIGQSRWPGGSLSEGKLLNSHYQYDISTDSILASTKKNTDDRDIDANLLNSASKNVGFSMILPTRQYYQEVTGGSKTAQHVRGDISSDIRNFIKNSSDNVTAPLIQKIVSMGNDFALEIGNETAHLGWANGNYNNSWNYGKIAGNILKSLDAHGAGTIVEHASIEIQMGINIGGARNIAKSLLSELNNAKLSHVKISGLVSHRGLVGRASDFDYKKEIEICNYWEKIAKQNDSVFRQDDELVFDASAWGVGSHKTGSDSLDLGKIALSKNHYVGENWDLTSDGKSWKQISDDFHNMGRYDIGARQATGTVDVFAKLLSLGYSKMTVWGAVDPGSHFSSYQLDPRGYSWNNPSSSKTSPLSHGGETLKLLSENLVGAKILSKGAADTRDGGWSATYENWTRPKPTVSPNCYYFESGGSKYLVSTVNDLDGDRATSTGKLTFGHEAYGRSTVKYTSIGTARDNDSFAEFINSSGDLLTPHYGTDKYMEFLRLFERPVVSEGVLQAENDRIEYSFHSDYELVLFEFSDEGPNHAPVVYRPASGYSLPDTLAGAHISFGDLRTPGSETTLSSVCMRFDSTSSRIDVSSAPYSDLMTCVVGGGGDDTIATGDFSVVVFSDGLDVSSNLVAGEAGGGDDTISTSRGSDSIFSGHGDDSILSGEGDDFVDSGSGSDTINLGSGNDIFHDYPNPEFGSSDLVIGEWGDDTIFSHYGNDTIYSGQGDDSIVCSTGDQLVYLEGGRNYVSTGDGSDTVVSGTEGLNHVELGGGDDVFLGVMSALSGSNSSAVYGGSGSDTLISSGGADCFYGGEGADCFIIRPGGREVVLGDFQADDVIDLSQVGVENEQIELHRSASSLIIEYGDITIELMHTEELSLEHFYESIMW